MSQNSITDPIIKKLMESASFGEAATIFLSSDMGKYIVQKATDEIDAAVGELMDADPFECKKVAELQQRIRAAQGALVWFGEAIDEGRLALEQLEEHV